MLDRALLDHFSHEHLVLIIVLNVQNMQFPTYHHRMAAVISTVCFVAAMVHGCVVVAGHHVVVIHFLQVNNYPSLIFLICLSVVG